MLPVSDAFLSAVRYSHEIVCRARILTTPGDTGANPDGRDLLVVDGTITLDPNADIRGTLDLTVADPWSYGATTADVAPYGTEIAVSRGVRLANTKIERCPLGIFRVDTVEQQDAPQGSLRITAFDRMASLIEATLTAPVQFLAGQTNGDVVSALVTDVLPSAVIEWDDDTDAIELTRAQIVEGSRHDFLADLVKSYGKIMYFDYRGVLVIKDPPDPGAVVWEVDAGRRGAKGVLVSAGRSRTRQGAFNAWPVTGDAVDDFTPASWVEYDLDPASPTRYGGPFGKVPAPLYSSPNIVTLAQAKAAAAAQKMTASGLPYSVSFQSVPNPALEPLDAVRLVYPPVLGNTPATKREIHVLDRITIPLSVGGVLEAATRVQGGAST